MKKTEELDTWYTNVKQVWYKTYECGEYIYERTKWKKEKQIKRTQ